VVPGAEGLLLHDHGKGLRDHRSAHYPSHHASDTTTTASHAAANSTCYPWRTSGPIQLRRGSREHLESGQEGLVLSDSSPWVPADSAAAAAAAAHLATAAAHLATGAAHLATGAADNASEACRPIQL